MTELHNGFEHGPDYVFGGNRGVSEDTWPSHEMAGVENVIEALPEDDPEALREALAVEGHFYGSEHLMLGDAFDQASQRPLRHKPGIGMYTTRAGAVRRESILRTRSEDSGNLRVSPILKLGSRTVAMAAGDRISIKRD